MMRMEMAEGPDKASHYRVTSRLESPESAAVLVRDGRELRPRARHFIVACGAVNSAALLLRPGSNRSPDSLANSSGRLRRNYMFRTSTFLVALDPRRRNTVSFQKTLGVNDPRRSVLGPYCRTHDVANLWVVDSSCFPASAALNPALTIAANALRARGQD